MATESLKLGRAWDNEFRGWTDELLLGRKQMKPKRASKGASMWTGGAVKPKVVADYKGKGSHSDVRGRLQGIARKSRQVMVKITGGGRNGSSIKNHFDYLSRDGELTLRDQDGREVTGKEALADLAWGWKHGGPALDESGARKEAFNIVFSMPEGTDERAVYEAIRSTAESEFAGHQWVMVQHTDEPQVHAHVCVKAESMDGHRLNPRKADLQRWREKFAYELRERGIEAEATRRKTRMHAERVDQPWAGDRKEREKREAGPLPEKPQWTAYPERVKEWLETEARTDELYKNIIASLGRSKERQDVVLAQELQGFIQGRNAGRQQPAQQRTNQQAERA